MNLAIIFAQEHEINNKEGVEYITKEHNKCAYKFAKEINRLRVLYPKDLRFEKYLESMQNLVKGNLETMHLLSERYGGTQSLLSQLNLWIDI